MALSFWSPGPARAADALPAPWDGMNIGAPSGSAGLENGVFTLSGGGSGLAGADDGFHFVYQSLVGDCALTARVSSGADAGVMARQALSSDSDFVAVALTPGHGTASLFRTPYAPRTASEGADDGSTSPVWVKLVKRGTGVQGYRAADRGAMPGAWKQIGGTLPVPSGLVYVGLWQAGGAAATFDHVSLTGGPLPLMDDGLYTISPASGPNMALTGAAGSVRLAPADGSAGQKWRLVNKGGASYSLQPLSDPSLVLSVPGAKSDSGSPVAALADRGLDWQRWSIIAGTDSTACCPGSTPRSAWTTSAAGHLPGTGGTGLGEQAGNWKRAETRYGTLLEARANPVWQVCKYLSTILEINMLQCYPKNWRRDSAMCRRPRAAAAG